MIFNGLKVVHSREVPKFIWRTMDHWIMDYSDCCKVLTISLGCVPRSGRLKWSVFVKYFLTCCQIVFQKDCTIKNSTNRFMNVLVFFYSPQNGVLYFQIFWFIIVVNITGYLTDWYFMTLISIWLLVRSILFQIFWPCFPTCVFIFPHEL